MHLHVMEAFSMSRIKVLAAIFDSISSTCMHKYKFGQAFVHIICESGQLAPIVTKPHLSKKNMSSSNEQRLVHVALLPSAGMGHLTPFLRLAALLSVHNVQVTFITPNPTVSLAESQTLSQFFASFPQITRKQLHLLPLDKQLPNSDPFYYHFEVIRHSSHLLSFLLPSLSPPLSALITDMSLASSVIPITQALSLPNYVFFTSSAKMLTLFMSFHTIVGPKATADVDQMAVIKIPSLESIPKSWIPPPLLQKTTNLLKTFVLENGKKMTESSGILVNTFERFEQEVLTKLNDGKVIERLPSVIAIGPLPPCHVEKSQPLAWLDGQAVRSVLYVSFGSRTAMSREQIRELGNGLVKSGSRFVWVVKKNKVDRDEDEYPSQIIGDELMDEIDEKGLVTKWLNQEELLSHPAIGGFLSHCGWNSVTEAAWHGVPILAWPQHGDQKINADIVESIGLGKWVKSWGWGGETAVNESMIAEEICKMMSNESLRVQATRIREEARRSMEENGSSKRGLGCLIGMWKSGLK